MDFNKIFDGLKNVIEGINSQPLLYEDMINKKNHLEIRLNGDKNHSASMRSRFNSFKKEYMDGIIKQHKMVKISENDLKKLRKNLLKTVEEDYCLVAFFWLAFNDVKNKKNKNIKDPIYLHHENGDMFTESSISERPVRKERLEEAYGLSITGLSINILKLNINEKDKINEAIKSLYLTAGEDVSYQIVSFFRELKELYP